MSKGFINGFTSWLDSKIKLHVKCAEHLEKLVPGTVYIAPDNMHLEVIRQYDALHANLTSGEPVSGFLPSITVMMRSVSLSAKSNAIGLLLTGMGNDGAQGMLELKKIKSHTVVQGPESSVVFGMGAVAKNLGAVDEVIELDSIAAHLLKIFKSSS
jgi:two-component system chemotaxis response regulator CheB